MTNLLVFYNPLSNDLDNNKEYSYEDVKVKGEVVIVV